MSSYPVKIAASLFIISITVIGVYFMHPVLVPLLLAFLFAILLRPVVAFLNYRLKFPHVIAVFTTVILAILVGISIVFFISRQISTFSEDIPNIKQHLNIHYHNIQSWIHEKLNISYRNQNNYIEKVTHQIEDRNELMGNTLDRFSTVILTLVLLPIYTFLILLYRTLFIKFLTKVVNIQHHIILKEIMFEIKTVVRSYIVGLLLEMAIIATMISAGLMIVGVEYPIFMGVVAAILNLIPYIGIFTAALLTMTVALGSSSELSMLISVIVIFAVVHFIDGNILIPRVVSSKIKINALAAMIGVVGGGALIGISGMFLALPIIAIIKVIFDRIPALEPWGYLLGDTIPKTFDWHNIKLPDLNVGNEEEDIASTPHSVAKDEEPRKESN